MKNTLLLILFAFNIAFSFAQDVNGTVTDDGGNPLPGVNVIEEGTANGTTTDFDGNYNITVGENAKLVFSYVGFSSQTLSVNNQSVINVTLSEGVGLDEVIIVGSRTAPRSNTDSPLPVDVLPVKELTGTGQISFDKALQYRIPSFNTVQTPVNDATSLLDPYEIRNMGPSRTLILINGKRKNLSALLYTQTSPGRGESGSDISAIPTDAIKRVEILRDGASAQYGSDAIAGVMNIILKDSPETGSASLRAGVTSEGDGETFAFSVNNGSAIAEDKGFINYTIDLSKVYLSNRPGTVNADGEAADFSYTNPTIYNSYLDEDGFTLGGVNITGLTEEQRQDQFAIYSGTPAFATRNAEILSGNVVALEEVNEFLGRNPDANNINGSPETTSSKFLVNGGFDLSDNSQIYLNAAYVYKKVNSFANYRTPYWRTLDVKTGFPYLADFFPGNNPNNRGGYDGYVPTFEGNLNDYNGTVGFKSKINDWNLDLSYTTGGNTQTYAVNNSHNGNEVLTADTTVGDINGNGFIDIGIDPYDVNGDGVIGPDEGLEFLPGTDIYRENSPRSFDPGGTKFTHNVGNIDISRILSDQISIGFGAEFRNEVFEVIQGGLASYDGGGADSFAGNRPEDSGKFNRYNFGGYFSIDWDVNEDFLLSGTLRAENYSDFGNAFVWKLSSRYKFLEDKLTLRASLSTGFRAPTLHQIYTQKAQYSFVPGQGIQVGGLVNNVSSQAQLLGIPQLDAEESTNFTIGLGAKISNNFNFTLDYYNIAVDDRIVLSTEIGPTEAGSTALDRVLEDNNLSDVSFFVNALDTRTSGIDFVANYKNIGIGNGKLGFSLSGNYTIENERDGAVKNPTLVEDAGQSVVNATQEALFFTSRPETKWILGTTYDVGKFGFNVNNTYFGKTTFKQQGLNDNLRTEFIPKVVTDFGVNFNASEKLTLALNVNNIFDVLPEWEFKAENAAGQAILDDTTTNWYGLTPIQEQSNLITFNQRYSQMTYDGYHFSQLGTMFNLSINYKF